LYKIIITIFCKFSHYTHQACVPCEDLMMEQIKKKRKKWSVWWTKTFGCGKEHLGHTMLMCGAKGAHTLLSLERLTETWVVFWKGWGKLGEFLRNGIIYSQQHGRFREFGKPHRHIHRESWWSTWESIVGVELIILESFSCYQQKVLK
jgi:hypothetical protein